MEYRHAFLSTLLTAAVILASPQAVLGASPSLAMAEPAVGGAQAGGGSGHITIIFPLDHQVVDSPHNTRLHYYVRPGLKTSQLHLSIDGGEPIALKDVDGCPCIFKLPSLASGRHRLTLTAVPGSPGTSHDTASVNFTVIGGLR